MVVLATANHSSPRFRLEWAAGQVPLKPRRMSEQLAKTGHGDQARAGNATGAAAIETMRDHNVIGIADTALLGMTVPAAGALEEPGSGVATKAILIRAILDQNVGQPCNQLTYQAVWTGSTLVRVPPPTATRACSNCGTVNDRPGTSRGYRCSDCSHEADQDENVTRNILEAICLEPTQPSADHVVELSPPGGCTQVGAR